MIQGVTNTFPPFGAGMARKGFKDRPGLVPTPSDLVGMRLKGLIDDATFKSMMAQTGYSAKVATGLLANTRNYLSVFDYVSLWRRGEMDRATLQSKLHEMGFDAKGTEEAIASTEYLPTPQDLVRFAVRDVYSPTIVESYGLDQDFPVDMLKRAAEVGLSSETAHEYWAAHWDLPSPTQVFEMLHRGLVTEDEVRTYLKTADYMPIWRDKLMAISYDNYTRVDIRRMFSFGVLTEEEVLKAYKELGYNDEKAKNLTRFTVLEVQHSKEETPTSNAIASYKAGSIDRSTAIKDLTSIGVDSTTAERMVEVADASLRQELIDLEADTIIDSYQRGAIDVNALRVQLTGIGVSARMMDLTVARELAQWRKRQKSASKTDYDVWWRMGVIGTVKYRKSLGALGYPDRDITLYLSELEVEEIAQPKPKYLWAEPMREFSDGTILQNGLDAALRAMGLNESTVNSLIAVAKGN